jgi:hypothetical protein
MEHTLPKADLVYDKGNRRWVNTRLKVDMVPVPAHMHTDLPAVPPISEPAFSLGRKSAAASTSTVYAKSTAAPISTVSTTTKQKSGPTISKSSPWLKCSHCEYKTNAKNLGKADKRLLVHMKIHKQESGHKEKCKQELVEEQTSLLDTCPTPSTTAMYTASDMFAKSLIPHTCVAHPPPEPEIIFIRVHTEDEIAISGSIVGTYLMSANLPVNQSIPNRLDKALYSTKLEMKASDNQLECSTAQNHVQYTSTTDKQPEPVLSPVSTSLDNILMVAALSVPATKDSVQHIPDKPPEPVLSPVSTSPDNVLMVAAMSEDPPPTPRHLPNASEQHPHQDHQLHQSANQHQLVQPARRQVDGQHPPPDSPQAVGQQPHFGQPNIPVYPPHHKLKVAVLAGAVEELQAAGTLLKGHLKQALQDQHGHHDHSQDKLLVPAWMEQFDRSSVISITSATLSW